MATTYFSNSFYLKHKLSFWIGSKLFWYVVRMPFGHLQKVKYEWKFCSSLYSCFPVKQSLWNKLCKGRFLHSGRQNLTGTHNCIDYGGPPVKWFSLPGIPVRQFLAYVCKWGIFAVVGDLLCTVPLTTLHRFIFLSIRDSIENKRDIMLI